MPPESSRAASSRGTAATRPVACLRCRRNRSFCTKERPICLTCRKGGHECVYSDGRKVSVLASYHYDLEARVKYYEYLLHQLKANPDFVLPSPSDVSTPAEGPSTRDDTTGPAYDVDTTHDEFDFQMSPLTEGLDNLVISPSGKPHYLGSSSSPILARRLREAVGMTTPTSGELHFDKEAAVYNHDALRLRRQSTTERMRLPPYKVAQRYFSAQYAMIGTIFSFVRPEDFEERLQQAYTGVPLLHDKDSCLAYCQVLLIMAFGQCYSVNQFVDAEGPPGFAFFTEALHFLPDVHDEPSVLFCGVLALVGYFMQNLNRRDAAFLYLGLAQRMAISLALHEEVSVPGLDEVTKEQRRRTWWSIYSLDRILCVKYGNPVTMHDSDVTVELPSRLSTEPEYCAAVVLRHYTILSQILGQIMTNIYIKTPKRSGSTLMQSVQETMSALARWERAIPDQLRFNPQLKTTSRENVSTFLHYYQCISMTARPLLFHIVKTRLATLTPGLRRSTPWKTASLSQTIVSVIETCIAAARDSIAMMTAAADKNLVAVFGYMDGEHIFSAALVLVMVGISFPYDKDISASMFAALSLLEMMASRGNHHIEARHGMLVQLLGAAECDHNEAHDNLLTSDTTTLPAETAQDGQGPAQNEVPLNAMTQGLISDTCNGYREMPQTSMYMSTLPVMDAETLEHMFSTSPGMGDLNMFEAAYMGTDMNIEMDPSLWSAETLQLT